MVWKKEFTIDELNRFKENTLMGHLDILFEKKGENFLTASMPVDGRTHQPFGILHGGASVALAETLGSCAAQMALDDGYYAVGLEIKANHIKSISRGRVTGRTTPLHLGRTTQVWDIDIKNDKEELICASRLTMAVLKQN